MAIFQQTLELNCGLGQLVFLACADLIVPVCGFLECDAWQKGKRSKQEGGNGLVHGGKVTDTIKKPCQKTALPVDFNANFDLFVCLDILFPKWDFTWILELKKKMTFQKPFFVHRSSRNACTLWHHTARSFLHFNKHFHQLHFVGGPLNSTTTVSSGNHVWLHKLM